MLRPFASTKLIIDGYGVRFRSAATTNSTILSEFNKGVELTYLANAGTGPGCSGPWYKQNTVLLLVTFVVNMLFLKKKLSIKMIILNIKITLKK